MNLNSKKIKELIQFVCIYQNKDLPKQNSKWLMVKKQPSKLLMMI